jgi:hypothetical protein
MNVDDQRIKFVIDLITSKIAEILATIENK